MIGKLNHVAIVVPDLEKATALYRDTLALRYRLRWISRRTVLPSFRGTAQHQNRILYPLGEQPGWQVPGEQSVGRHPSRLLRSTGYSGGPR